jgi:hypothetical protein
VFGKINKTEKKKHFTKTGQRKKIIQITNIKNERELSLQILQALKGHKGGNSTI